MTFRNTGKRDSGNTVSRDSAYLSANDGLLIPACSADKSIVIYDVLSYGSGKLGTAVDGGGTQLCLINAGQNHFGISAIVPAGQGVYTNAQSGNITITYAIVDGLPASSIRNTVTEGGGATTTTTTAAATTTTTTAAAVASNACVAWTSGNEQYWNVDSTFIPVVGANALGPYGRTQYVNADGSLWLAYNGTVSRWQIDEGVNLSVSNWFESDDDGTNPWDAAWTNGNIGVTERDGQGFNGSMYCYPTSGSNFCIAGQGSYPEYEGTWVPYNTYGVHNKPVYWNQNAGGVNLFMWYDNTNARWKINEDGWEPHEINGYSTFYLESDLSASMTTPSGANWSTEIASGTFDSIVAGDCSPATTTTAAPTTTTTTAAATTTTTTAAATTTTAAPASNFCMAEEVGYASYWHLNTVFAPVVGANATHNGKTQYTNIATVGASYNFYIAYDTEYTPHGWQLNDGVNLTGSPYGNSDGDADDPWDAGWTNAYVMTETSASHCAPAGTPSFCIDSSGYPEDGTWVPYATYGGKPVWALLDTTGSGDSLFMWYSASGSGIGMEGTWNFTDYGWGLHEDSSSSSIGNSVWGYGDADCTDPWDCAWSGSISGCSSYTVDTSTTVNFTKADWADSSLEANQDRITDGVWITRGDSQGLYNAFNEVAWDNSNYDTPTDTEWAVGTVAGGYGTNEYDYDDGSFDTWIEVMGDPSMGGGWGPANAVGFDFVLRIGGSGGILLDIKFTSWTSGDGSGGTGGGGFAYTRSVVTGPTSCVTEGSC